MLEMFDTMIRMSMHLEPQNSSVDIKLTLAYVTQAGVPWSNGGPGFHAASATVIVLTYASAQM